MTAGEANDIYDLRDCPEKQYSLMKTQLGNSVFLAHNMHRIAVREVIAFVASIIRHDIMRKCRDAKPSIDTNTATKELKLINMDLIGNSRYQMIHNQCIRPKEIMSLLGLTAGNLDYIASYETNRLNGKAVHPIQSLSQADKSTAASSASASDNKSSRQSNSKKKTAGQENSSKRGPGRPPGSKKKQKPETTEVVEKRDPGRPKGSKNKPRESEPGSTEKRKPGRPKGSKNKPKA
jgi:hypothetical protein